MRLLLRLSGVFLSVIVFLVGTFNTILPTESIENDYSTVYTDFISNQDNYRYDVETVYYYTGSYASYKLNDVYLFDGDYSYSFRDTYYTSYPRVGYERLVLYNTNGEEYYYRDRFHNNYGIDDLEYVPYLKIDCPEIKEEIDQILNDPIFSLNDYWDESETYFTLDFADLSAIHQEYILSNIHFYLPEIIINSSGEIGYSLLFESDQLTRIIVEYGGLIDGVSSFSQTFKISTNTYMDTMGVLADLYDLSALTTLNGSNLPTFGINEQQAFNEEFTSDTAQLVFIEIITPGVYVFRTTDDNKDLSPFWYLYDLQTNQLKNRLEDSDFGFYFDREQISIYLEAGIYVLYLQPLTINMNEATISYNIADPNDDYANCYISSSTPLEEDTVVEFTTNYEYDIDVFTVVSDSDYVIVTNISDYGLATEQNVDVEISYFPFSYIIKIPESGMVNLYFSSINLGIHQAKIRICSFTDTAIPFSESPQIDPYNMTAFEAYNLIGGYSFSGGVDRFQFDIIEDSIAYIPTGNASGRIFDSEFNEISPYKDFTYLLDEGHYYLELYDFNNIYTAFMIYPEPVGEEVRILDTEIDTHRILGFVDGTINDEDIYQFTLTEDSTLYFDNIRYKEVLIFGVDNPNVFVFDTRVKMPFYVPAGTYKMTLPNGVYNFLMTINSIEPEQDQDLTYSNIIVGDGVTTYQFFPSFDFYGDEEIIVLDIPAGSIINFTYSVYINKAILTYTSIYKTENYYIYSYNTSQREGNYLIFDREGTIRILLGVYDGYDLNDLPYGEILFEIHIWEEE